MSNVFDYGLVKWMRENKKSVIPTKDIEPPIEIGQITFAKFNGRKYLAKIVSLGGMLNTNHSSTFVINTI